MSGYGNSVGGGMVSIEFILDPETGLVESIKPAGVVGAQCAALTAPFERHFGGEKVDSKLPEFYQQEAVKQQAKLGEDITPDIELILDPSTGSVEFIHSDEAMSLAAGLAGRPAIRRASHVEPIAGTTSWEADMAPSGGPTLGPFPTKQEALDAEVAWLLTNRLYRGDNDDEAGDRVHAP